MKVWRERVIGYSFVGSLILAVCLTLGIIIWMGITAFLGEGKIMGFVNHYWWLAWVNLFLWGGATITCLMYRILEGPNERFPLFED